LGGWGRAGNRRIYRPPAPLSVTPGCPDWQGQPGGPLRVARGSTSIHHIPNRAWTGSRRPSWQPTGPLAQTPALTTLRCHPLPPGNPPSLPAMRSIVGQYHQITPCQLTRMSCGRHEIAQSPSSRAILYAMSCNRGYLKPTCRCLHCIQHPASIPRSVCTSLLSRHNTPLGRP